MMVSVVIPCYNQGAYLQDAINSVLSQNYTNWEIIIVDDGSDDVETIKFLKNYKAEKISIYFQENNGVSVARNFGAAQALGEYLLFLDGDDKIANEYLHFAIAAFIATPNLSYVYCDVQEFGETNNYRSLELLDLKKTLIHDQTHVSAVLTFSLWKLTTGFDAAFRTGWEDWDFIIRVLDLNVIYYKIPKAMLYYRIIKNSRDKIAVSLHSKALLNQIYLKHIDKYLKYFDEPITILRNNEILQKNIVEQQQHSSNIYKTFSYKLGATILMPLKFIKKYLFK